MPFSISSLASSMLSYGFLERSLWPQVWLPTECPAAATCLRISGVVGRVLADGEERGLGAMVGQCLQHRRRIARPGTVIKGQHHFAVAQEVVHFKVFPAKTRTRGGV